VTSTEGNYREHIDITYFVTDKGWRVTFEGAEIVASKDGHKKTFPYQALPGTTYDRFIQSLEAQSPMPRDFADVREAAEDIRIIRTGERNKGQRVGLQRSSVGDGS
jgi:hypothetical protein